MTLDPKSIDNVIQEVKKYKQTLDKRVKSLVEALVDRGVDVAKAQVRELGAVYTGELEDSIIGYFDESLGVGIIRADCPYAIYIEFGTGIVGKNNPHPAPKGWKYDVNEHGELGWWYFNDRDFQWHWTKGMESRPFMYNTVQLLKSEIERGVL